MKENKIYAWFGGFEETFQLSFKTVMFWNKARSDLAIFSYILQIRIWRKLKFYIYRYLRYNKQSGNGPSRRHT